MKLFEFEAKKILVKKLIPVPEGILCADKDEIKRAYEDMGGNVVLKSQVLVGGRGKAGGILFPKNSQEAAEMGQKLLAVEIKGEPVQKILVEKALDIDEEYYLGIITDTDKGCPLLMFSAEGGMEIEDLAKERPESIKRTNINPLLGLSGHKVRYLLRDADVPLNYHNQIIKIAIALYKTYWEMDGELIEINPLVVTKQGEIVAADTKFNIDNSALYRQPEVPKRPSQTVEERAADLGLSYVLLEGNIGIISNGAGLTMATMDHLNLAGGLPANFLDCGERILTDGVRDGMKIILEKPNVRAILINIFAGGPRCDVIAEKIVETINQMEKERMLHVDVVVTLHGRYMKEGIKILSQCKSPHLYHELEIEDAVHKVVELGAKAK